jgi:hypothetical protein
MRKTIFGVSLTLLLCSPLLAQETMGDIDGGTTITKVVDGDLIINGKIDGASRAVLISRKGSITVRGKIDGGSLVTICAAGQVVVGDKIDNPNTNVTLIGNGVGVGQKIDGGSQVRLSGTPGNVSLGDKIDNGATVVRWCGSSLAGPPNGANGGSRVIPDCSWVQDAKKTVGCN